MRLRSCFKSWLLRQDGLDCYRGTDVREHDIDGSNSSTIVHWDRWYVEDSSSRLGVEEKVKWTYARSKSKMCGSDGC